jgi:hypothetical protein
MRWAEHITHMEEMRNAYKSLVEIPEGKRTFGRHGNRWKDIRTDLMEIG